MSKLIVTQAYTKKKLATLDVQNEHDIDRALNTASSLKTKILSSHHRIKILKNIISIMQQREEELALIIANEGGKPIVDARVEVKRAIDGVDLAISGIRNIAGKQIPMDLTAAGENRLAFTILEPIGVVAAISAFNHPLNLTVHQVIPAIATGCPVIIKPATKTPLSAFEFLKIVEQAGLPQGYLQVVVTNNINTEKLVTDHRVSFFSFIGSARIGWMLKSKLHPGTRCALEHGGVAPLIVDDYKNIDGLVKGLAKAAFYHSGQVCVSVQRVYVTEDLALEFCAKLKKITANLIVGDAVDEKTDLGPLISEKEAIRIKKWVDEAVASGAKLITGGKLINDNCFEPTILLNPPEDSKVTNSEIFGPVVCIYSYKNVEEAIMRANSLDVAFQASVFTDNINKAIASAKKLAASSVMVNDYTTFRVDWMPFAGRKKSGYGIGGIEYTMRDMLEHKMVVIKTDA